MSDEPLPRYIAQEINVFDFENPPMLFAVVYFMLPSGDIEIDTLVCRTPLEPHTEFGGAEQQVNVTSLLTSMTFHPFAPIKSRLIDEIRKYHTGATKCFH